MRQALHIFRKDARRLRWEIAGVFALADAFAWSEAHLDWTGKSPASSENLLNWLLPIAWALLLARAIYQEPLAGHKQFWLTRPYSWKSLLAAKILFALVFITLPFAIADAAIVAAQGFPIAGHGIDLMREQALWWAVFILPASAVAAVTDGLESLLLWALAIGLGWLVTNGWLFGQSDWGNQEWLRSSLTEAVLACSGVVVVWQYARRRTWAARGAVAGILAMGIVIWVLPARAGFALNAAMLKRVSGVSIAFDPSRSYVSQFGGKALVDLVLQVSGLPSGLTPEVDRIRVRIEEPGGRMLQREEAFRTDSNSYWNVDGAKWGGLGHFDGELDELFQAVVLTPECYDQIKQKQVRIKATLLLTLYGDPRTVPLPRDAVSVNIPRFGTCDILEPGGSGPQELCREPFLRPQGRLLDSNDFEYYESSRPERPTFRISPIVAFAGYYRAYQGRYAPLRLTLEQPVAHFRTDFEIGPIRLADFEVSGSALRPAN